MPGYGARRNSSGWDFGAWRQELNLRSSGVRARKTRAARGEATHTVRPRFNQLKSINEKKSTRPYRRKARKPRKSAPRTIKPQRAGAAPAPAAPVYNNAYSQPVGRDGAAVPAAPAPSQPVHQVPPAPSPYPQAAAPPMAGVYQQPPQQAAYGYYAPPGGAGYQPPQAGCAGQPNHYYAPPAAAPNGITVLQPAPGYAGARPVAQPNHYYQAPPAAAAPVQAKPQYRPAAEQRAQHQQPAAQQQQTQSGYATPPAVVRKYSADNLEAHPGPVSNGLSVHAFRWNTTNLNFWQKIFNICETWHLENKKSYRSATGYRLIRGGNGRTNVNPKGQQLQSFSETLQKIHLFTETNIDAIEDGERLGGTYIIMALYKGRIVAMMDLSMDYRRQAGRVNAAVSRRALDNNLPRGVMSSCVHQACNLILEMGWNRISVPVMATSAVSFWGLLGIPRYGSAPANNVQANTARNGCANGAAWPGIDNVR